MERSHPPPALKAGYTCAPPSLEEQWLELHTGMRRRRRRRSDDHVPAGGVCSTGGAACLSPKSMEDQSPHSIVRRSNTGIIGRKCAAAVAITLGAIQLASAGSPGDNDGRGGSSNSDNNGGKIGDMHRSDSSTTRFFRSIDSDGDGILEKPEMESFVRDTIGGSAFDTSAEVQAGVDQVLEQLDRDKDDGLDRDDVLAHWMQLESLLTAEEVSEWVVHAVQLPNEVGGVFLDHLVTGYDFPELVDHGGEAIESELGITKASYRKKIMRHINARMLGIGTVPTAPSNFRHTLESCSTVSLSWSKSTAKGFPVHSYRVQRRAVPLHASSSAPSSPGNAAAATSPTTTIASPSRVGVNERVAGQALICDAAIDASHSYFPTCGNDNEVSFAEEYAVVCAESDATTTVRVTPTVTIVDSKPVTPVVPAPTSTHSSWVTIYRGADNEFVDSTLEDGHTYVYRVQAWNSVGKSDWTSLDIARSLKKQGCTTRPVGAGSKPYDGVLPGARGYGRDESSGWTILRTIYFIFDFISTFVRAIFALAAVGAAIMRFKRANALSSTSADVEVVFPWLWNGINKVSTKLFGIDIIPKAILGDKKSKMVSESAYDKEIKSVGLAGYRARPSNSSPGDDRRISNKHDRPNRRAMFAQRRSVSASQIKSSLDKIREDELLGNDGDSGRPNGILGRRGSNERPSAGDIYSRGAANGSNGSVGNTSSSKKPKTLLKKTFFGRSKSAGQGSNDGSASTGSSGGAGEDPRLTMRSMPADISTSRRSLMTEMSTIDEDDGTVRTNSSSARDLLHDDYNRCNCCHKRYKFPHRFRHHCARCLSTFCHKHGKTTHSNLISCKVPSDCICDVCLEADGYSSRSRTSSRNGSSNGGSRR